MPRVVYKCDAITSISSDIFRPVCDFVPLPLRHGGYDFWLKNLLFRYIRVLIKSGGKIATLPTDVSRAISACIRCKRMNKEETMRYVSQVVLLFIISHVDHLSPFIFLLLIALFPPSWIDLEAEVPSQGQGPATLDQTHSIGLDVKNTKLFSLGPVNVTCKSQPS